MQSWSGALLPSLSGQGQEFACLPQSSRKLGLPASLQQKCNPRCVKPCCVMPGRSLTDTATLLSMDQSRERITMPEGWSLTPYLISPILYVEMAFLKGKAHICPHPAPSGRTMSNSPRHLMSDGHRVPAGASSHLPEGVPCAFVAVIFYSVFKVLASEEVRISTNPNHLLTV